MEYSNAYSQTSGNLWQYYRDEPAVNHYGNVIDFSDNINNSISLKFKQQTTEHTGNSGTMK